MNKQVLFFFLLGLLSLVACVPESSSSPKTYLVQECGAEDDCVTVQEVQAETYRFDRAENVVEFTDIWNNKVATLRLTPNTQVILKGVN